MNSWAMPVVKKGHSSRFAKKSDVNLNRVISASKGFTVAGFCGISLFVV